MKPVLYIGCPVAERSETEKLLAAARVSMVCVDTVAQAMSELNRRDMPVLLDLSRGASALQIARDLRAQRAATLMFAVVDERRPDLTTEAVLEGLADVFARPLGGRRVANAIAREMAYESRRDRPADAARGDLYTQSPSMREVSALIARAATMRAGVLIRGEEGTGREIVGRAIHGVRPAPAGAFVKIDCAAFDADQLDAALFGSAQRSPNGDASRGLQRVSRGSRLYAAHGGTLYLQNVADAPARAQARLARVLRDREAILSETGEAIDLDVRPMAGVNLRFEHAVDEGRVREDLLRRLSVVRIDMPPLRNRREDIPALANYFLREICAAQRVPPKTLSRAALSLIAALPWRGNAAELHSLIESIVTSLAGGRGISLDDVLAHVQLDGGAAKAPNGGTLRQARSRFEREYIASVLEHHHGRISEAAKALGIQRTNLYRKMRSLRLSPDRGRRS
ncbi:MAG TPA: sigma 54-interacting transcriptional regulator [Vicinamibacterales bacterium]|jgi:two-component system nitrogen regulation response regulator NtrX|nr:sigma 54-interacting transcriptional regulator [Vicinamibacterales bacterium]